LRHNDDKKFLIDHSEWATPLHISENFGKGKNIKLKMKTERKRINVQPSKNILVVAGFSKFLRSSFFHSPLFIIFAAANNKTSIKLCRTNGLNVN